MGSGSCNAVGAATQLGEETTRRRAGAPHHLLLQAPCRTDQISRVCQVHQRGSLVIRVQYVAEENWGGAGSSDADVSADRPVLVPLTTSLYVPGALADSESVIVDVGTGFYVEKVGSRRGHMVRGDVDANA